MNRRLPLHRLKNEISLLRYSLRILVGPSLVAIVMIVALLIVLVFTSSPTNLNTKLANLLFQMEMFAPLLGIVVFVGLMGTELDSRHIETLTTSAEGIVRIVARKLVHATLFTAAACLIALSTIRITYTSFSITWALGLVLPGALYFGMLGLLATAATRSSLAGFTAGTAALIISIAGRPVNPLLTSSYTYRDQLVNERLLQQENWLVAKLFFVVMAVVLSAFVLRTVSQRGARLRTTLVAVILLVAGYAAVHAIWARPPQRRPLPNDVILDIRERDDELLVRFGRTVLARMKDYGRRERAEVNMRRYARDGDQWVQQSELAYHPNSELDLVDVDIQCEIAPQGPTLEAVAGLQMVAVTGPLYRVFFFLGGDLQIAHVKFNGEPAAFNRYSDLVEVVLPAPMQKGETFELELQYAGPLSELSDGVADDFIVLFEHWYPTTRDRRQNWVDPFTCRASVQLPPSWRLAGGTLVSDDDSRSLFQWESRLPIHLVPLCVGKFRHYQALYRDIPISINVFKHDEAFARRLLDRCLEILPVHEQAFGPYPFPQLTFVENRFQGAGGMAHPGCMTIQSERLTSEQEASLMDLLLPHELAHQWWRVGLPKWVAESGAVYGNYHFLEQTQGRKRAKWLLDDTLYAPYIRSNAPMTPLVSDYKNLRSIYARGGYLLVMLESLLGKDTLLQTLRDYYESHAQSSMADEDEMNRDLERTLQQAVGEQWRSFISDWMHSTKRFDPAIVSLEQKKLDETHDITLRLAHQGDLRFPVSVRVSFDDGSSVDQTWSTREDHGEIHLQNDQPAASAEIDVYHKVLDWNRGNNRALPTIPRQTTLPKEVPYNKGWQTYTVEDGLSAPSVRCLLVGRDGHVYVGCGYHNRFGGLIGSEWNLNYFDGEWHDLVPHSNRGCEIHCMTQTTDGTLWIGGRGNLWRVKGDQAREFELMQQRAKFDSFSSEPIPDATSTIPGRIVHALLSDEHRLWVGTDKGISLLDTRQRTWRHFSQADGLPGPTALTLARGDQGAIWAGTSGGITSFTDGQWKSHPQHARDDLVLAAATDSQGTTWFGTYRNGILRVRDGSQTHFTSANSPLPHDMVPSLVCDAKGHVWAGTAEGLVFFDGKTWEHFHQGNSGLPSNRIQRLAVDDSGHLWIGTDVGLTHHELK